MTQQELLILALQRRGYSLLRTGPAEGGWGGAKPVVLKIDPNHARRLDPRGLLVFIGPAGGIRIGRTRAESRPLLPATKANLLDEGRKAQPSKILTLEDL